MAGERPIAWLSADAWPNAAPGGEYRFVGDDGSLGGLATWVDDAPHLAGAQVVTDADGREHEVPGTREESGAGHFEPYRGKPGDYLPRRLADLTDKQMEARAAKVRERVEAHQREVGG